MLSLCVSVTRTLSFKTGEMDEKPDIILSDWMGNLPEKCFDMPLSQIAIPGKSTVTVAVIVVVMMFSAHNGTPLSCM